MYIAHLSLAFPHFPMTFDLKHALSLQHSHSKTRYREKYGQDIGLTSGGLVGSSPTRQVPAGHNSSGRAVCEGRYTSTLPPAWQRSPRVCSILLLGATTSPPPPPSGVGCSFKSFPHRTEPTFTSPSGSQSRQRASSANRLPPSCAIGLLEQFTQAKPIWLCLIGSEERQWLGDHASSDLRPWKRGTVRSASNSELFVFLFLLLQ